MSAMPERIEQYHILQVLGEGAMGVVYRGRHELLGRDVAIKCLAQRHANNPARRERLGREAKFLAGLDHPNIARLWHVIDAGDAFYLVLEYVPGRTLYEELAIGRMRLRDAIAVASQIALALDDAHRTGIIHRDLKPANIKIRPDRCVKVLDFGLAKLVGEAAGQQALAEQTRGFDETRTGAIVGTPGYMAPEQVRGERVDKRADIFAFGCVLFELLSGARTFAASSSHDTMAATLRDEPKWSTLPPATPALVRSLLERCLARDRERRLRDIGDALLDLESVLDAIDPSTATRPVPQRSKGNLSSDLTLFIGRRQELDEAEGLLTHSRLLTLTGAGGCGKTRLARRLGVEVEAGFADGIWLIELAALADARSVAGAAAAAMGLADAGGEPIAAIVDHLRDRATLLILDNCEHVLQGVRDFVVAVLSRCRSVKIVATSRESLGLPGEQRFRVPSLRVPHPDRSPGAASIEAFESVQLFLERVRLSRPDFEITDRNAEHVARICHRLDGIPLAIELAAARLRSMTIDQIAQRLTQSLRLLKGGSHSGLARHETMSGTIDWSYQHLSETERLVFRRLSVFRGGCSLEAAEAVCAAADDVDGADVIDHLTALVDKSLIWFEATSGGEGRYRIWEPLRQFGEERLSEAVEVDRTQRAHLSFFMRFAQRAEPNLSEGGHQAEWMNRVALDHDNLRAAMTFGFDESETTESAGWIACGLHRFWFARGHLSEGTAWLIRGLDAAEERHLTGRLLGAHAMLAHAQGDFDAARDHYEKCIEIWRDLGEDSRRAAMTQNLGIVLLSLGDRDASRAQLAGAAEIYRKMGDRRRVTMVNLNRAALLLDAGEIDEAHLLLAECLPEFEKEDDLVRLAAAHENLSEIALARSDPEHAERHARRAVEARSRLDDRKGIATALTLLARVLLNRSRPDDAATLLGAADGLRHEIGVTRAGAEENDIADLEAEVRKLIGDSHFDELHHAGAEHVRSGKPLTALIGLPDSSQQTTSHSGEYF